MGVNEVDTVNNSDTVVDIIDIVNDSDAVNTLIQ